MRNILFLNGLLLIMFMSCGDSNSSETSSQTEPKEQQPEISAKAIEAFRYNDYAFSNDAASIVSEWGKYQELNNQIDFLKQADITFFTENKDTLKTFIDTLKSSIPEVINTSSINARLIALENSILKLNNDLSLDNYPKSEKLKSIKQLLISNSNLIYYVNKKIEFDKKDVERPE